MILEEQPLIYREEPSMGGGAPQTPPPESPNHLIKRQRRQISRVGFAGALFLILPLLAQILFMSLFSLLENLTGRSLDMFDANGLLALSSISMYLVAFPLSAAVLCRVPRCGWPEQEKWGIGRLLICLVLGSGLGFAGSLLAQAAEAMGAESAGAEEFTELIMETSLWMNLLFTVIIGPVVEELFYRKLVLDRLLGFGQLTAVLISALMFALAHGNFSQFFYAFALGLVWGYVYAKTGKIRYTITLHMVFNFFGSVLVLEFTKLMENGFQLSPFLRQLLGEGAELLEVFLLVLGKAMGSMFIFMYGLLVLGCFVATGVLFFTMRRRIRFTTGKWPIQKGRRFRTVILNGGMITYLILCAVLFWWNS